MRASGSWPAWMASVSKPWFMQVRLVRVTGPVGLTQRASHQRAVAPVGNTGAVTPPAKAPEPLPSRLAGTADRIPASLDALVGPAHGRVERPVRLGWSGLTEFDVADPRQRLTSYRTLLDCGQLDDLVRYVNGVLLRGDWPRIKRLTSRRLVTLWEQRLPELGR